MLAVSTRRSGSTSAPRRRASAAMASRAASLSERLRLVGEGGGVGQRGQDVRGRAQAGPRRIGLGQVDERGSRSSPRRDDGAEAVGRARPSRASREHARIVGAGLAGRGGVRAQSKIGWNRWTSPPSLRATRRAARRPSSSATSTRPTEPWKRCAASPSRSRPASASASSAPTARARRPRSRSWRGCWRRPAGEVVVLGRRWGHDDQAIRERMGVCLQQTVLSEKLQVRRDGGPLPQLLPRAAARRRR